MYKRKTFLKLSGGAALGLFIGSAALPACAGGSNSPDDSSGDSDSSDTAAPDITATGTITNLGLQLYTLRDAFPQDPKGVLKQVAAAGYKELESYEGDQGIYWGLGNKGFQEYVQGLGMKIVSAHCDYKKDMEKKAAEAAEIGMRYLACPWLGRQEKLDDYKRIADEFNKAGEICKKNGIRFAYHNHDYSFREQEGQFPQDILMGSTDKDLVDFEMDIYWVVTAGQDPVAWLKKYNGRFRLCHIKDRKKDTPFKEGEPNLSVIVGTGSIDFKTILATAKAEGMQHYILEQEAYEKAPVECIREGAAYLNKLVF